MHARAAPANCAAGIATGATPFELMTWLDDSTGRARGGIPRGCKCLAECAIRRTYEARESEVGNFIGPRSPARIVADFRPGKTGFEKVHVRIGFAPVDVGLARAESAGCTAPVLLDLIPKVKCAPLKLRARVERGRRRGKSEQHK